MSKRAHSAFWILMPLLLAVGCTGMGAAQLFLTAEFIMRRKAIDLFLSKRARTLKAGPLTRIAAKEAENNG
jgi:hypothetical protein